MAVVLLASLEMGHHPNLVEEWWTMGWPCPWYIGLRQHSNFFQNLLGHMHFPELHGALGMSGDLDYQIIINRNIKLILEGGNHIINDF
jgi:hypothetical protein